VLPQVQGLKGFYRAMAMPMAIAVQALAPEFTPTPEHNLINHGGRTIQDLVYTNFFIGGASSLSEADIERVDEALAAGMADTNLNNVMMQYFKNKPITTTFKPSHILPGARPFQFSQGDFEQLSRAFFCRAPCRASISARRSSISFCRAVWS
jgi:hypothetical protein